jgi:enterochelin esterase-like enzyme
MKPHPLLLPLVLIVVLLSGCRQKTRAQEEKLYSRHLQAHIKLTVISTPLPDDRKGIHLILMNDGQDATSLRLQKTTDSLYRKGMIQPVLVVAIHPNNRISEYGIAGYPDLENRGNRADKYGNFIINELLPHIKKQSDVRKFSSVTLMGCSQGGLSAFDIAWNNADKIDRVAVLSGSFWWRDKKPEDPSYSDAVNRITHRMVQSSRKRPSLGYWFYAGTAEETGDRDKDGVIDVIDDTQDLIDLINKKNLQLKEPVVFRKVEGGKHNTDNWASILPEFMVWAIGKSRQ